MAPGGAARVETMAVKQAARPGGKRLTGEITPVVFVRMIEAVSYAIEERADWLSELDGVIGDGDHGVTMSIGWKAVRESLAARSADEDIEATCRRVARAFLDAVGASSGPLYASAFLKAGGVAANRDGLDAAALVDFLGAAAEGIRERGKAEPGDKTMLDAWWPAIQAAREALAEGADLAGCLRAAAAGAERGMKETANIAARRGRAAKLGERSLGHIDPGSASTFVMIDTLRRSFEEQTR
jgi:dihydroxyacetone kinase